MDEQVSLQDVLDSAREFGSQIAECQNWKDNLGENQVQQAWDEFFERVPEIWHEHATVHFNLGYHGRKIRS